MHKQSNRRRRPHDYPELQVGYPERNDVSNPNEALEQVHDDAGMATKKSAARIVRGAQKKEIAHE